MAAKTPKQKTHKKPAKKAGSKLGRAAIRTASGSSGASEYSASLGASEHSGSSGASSSHRRELRIAAIRDGTVIDHVPAAKVFDVVEILNLKSHKDVVSIATNLGSKKIGKKGIVKVAGRELTKLEVDEIAVVAPQATINIIKDFKVRQKSIVEVPAILTAAFKCSNPKCVSNIQPVESRFEIISKSPVKAICFYCERVMGGEEIRLK
ncbi:aspartate carbamoyltransferase regulatory subunit [Candidatus Woesearchaeota archaeon]|nr:aspartate carbamoyltransferase regulatory subunit [Candidatus Woesearchaeota archaeon]